MRLIIPPHRVSVKMKLAGEGNSKHTNEFVNSWTKDSKRPKFAKMSFLWLPDERRKEKQGKKC